MAVAQQMLWFILLPIILVCCCVCCIACICCGCLVMLLRAVHLMPPEPEPEDEQQPQQQRPQPPKQSIIMSTTSLAPPHALTAVVDIEEGLN